MHVVSFENFVKSMPPSLLELKVTPSFCFPFKIPDNPTATIVVHTYYIPFHLQQIEPVACQEQHQVVF